MGSIITKPARRRRYITNAQRTTARSFLTLPFSKAIKPALEIRPAQLKAVNFLINSPENYGLALVTGFGKTIIDIQVMDIIWQLERTYRQPLSKFLVLVPTVDLAGQVLKEFRRYRKFKRTETVLLADTSPAKRKKLYLEDALVFISTPQGITNDLQKDRLSHDFFNIPIIDEAHRAVRKYSYTTLIKLIKPHTKKIIAQTATPPDKKNRTQVNEDLNLSGWYTISLEEQLAWQYPIDRRLVNIEMTPEWSDIWQRMEATYKGYYKKLHELLFKHYEDQEVLKEKPSLLFFSQMQELKDWIDTFKENRNFWPKAIHLWVCISKQLELMRKLFQENFESAFRYYTSLSKSGEDKIPSKADSRVFEDNQAIMAKVDIIRQNGLHPKIAKIIELFNRHKSEQIVVFQRFVESIKVLQVYLKKHKYYSSFLIGKGHTNIQTKREAALARRKIQSGQAAANVSPAGNEGLNIFSKARVAIVSSPFQSSQQMIQAEGRMSRTHIGDIIDPGAQLPVQRQKHTH